MSFPDLPQGTSDEEISAFASVLVELFRHNEVEQVQGHVELEKTCHIIAAQLDVDAVQGGRDVYAERAALRKLALMRTTFREELSYIFLLAGKLTHREKLDEQKFVREMLKAFRRPDDV